MKRDCPHKNCIHKEIQHQAIRYLDGDYQRKIMKTAYTWLVLFDCPEHSFFQLRRDVPTKTNLEWPERFITEINWSEWHRALRKKPGVRRMGTTAGEYTDIAHRDPASVSKQILNYEKVRQMPNVSKEQHQRMLEMERAS